MKKKKKLFYAVYSIIEKKTYHKGSRTPLFSLLSGHIWKMSTSTQPKRKRPKKTMVKLLACYLLLVHMKGIQEKLLRIIITTITIIIPAHVDIHKVKPRFCCVSPCQKHFIFSWREYVFFWNWNTYPQQYKIQ